MELSVQGCFPPTDTSYPPPALFNRTIYGISSGVTDVPVTKASVSPSLLMGSGLSFQSRSPRWRRSLYPLG